MAPLGHLEAHGLVPRHLHVLHRLRLDHALLVLDACPQDRLCHKLESEDDENGDELGGDDGLEQPRPANVALGLDTDGALVDHVGAHGVEEVEPVQVVRREAGLGVARQEGLHHRVGVVGVVLGYAARGLGAVVTASVADEVVLGVLVRVVEAEDVADLVHRRGLEVVAVPAGQEDVVEHERGEDEEKECDHEVDQVELVGEHVQHREERVVNLDGAPAHAARGARLDERLEGLEDGPGRLLNLLKLDLAVVVRVPRGEERVDEHLEQAVDHEGTDHGRDEEGGAEDDANDGYHG
mmetsp:Transcript_17346/g.50419  ORF Transcript_17346/g.50419 Transcript_17346/m.50419 type:complete len:295 (+) Transcript_17346:375-1259(+)